MNGLINPHRWRRRETERPPITSEPDLVFSLQSAGFAPGRPHLSLSMESVIFSRENAVLSMENKSLAMERNFLSRENFLLSRENKSLAMERDFLSRERNSLAMENAVLSREGNSDSMEIRSPATQAAPRYRPKSQAGCNANAAPFVPASFGLTLLRRTQPQGTKPFASHQQARSGECRPFSFVMMWGARPR